MRKPNQPNVAAALVVIQAQKNARGVKSLATEYTASAKQEVPQVSVVSYSKTGGTPKPRPSSWGLIRETKNRRFGLFLMTERKVCHV